MFRLCSSPNSSKDLRRDDPCLGRMVRQGTGRSDRPEERRGGAPVGDPQQERDDQARRYWQIRTALEVIKAGAWIAVQWPRSGGPSGPLT
jgi:hypothetical protein